MIKITRVLLAVCGTLLVSGAAAQTFPDKPVKIVVPWPPGGGADYVARTFGSELSETWKQPVIIENLAGAGSIIGAERAANSAPDGYTLMLTINGTIVGNRFLYKQLPYDPDRSFVPISLLVQSGQLILANAAVPANSLREFVALAKRDPKKYAYASYGNGTQPHLLFEVLNKREGLQLLHVPYKGLAPALTAVMGGEVQVTVVSPSSADAAIKSGKAKPLAIGSETRANMLPDVPTVVEAGFPYIASTIWFGLFAPAGTPTAVIDRLQRDVAAITSEKAFADKMSARGLDVLANGPARFAAVIREEVSRTAEMVEAAGVKPE